MHLEDVYPAEAAVNIWKREFIYSHKDGSLVLKDSYELEKLLAPSCAYLITCKEPVKISEGKVRLFPADGKGALVMTYDPKILSLTVMEKAVDDRSLSHIWGEKIYRVKLEDKTHALRQTHTITFGIEK